MNEYPHDAIAIGGSIKKDMPRCYEGYGGYQ